MPETVITLPFQINLFGSCFLYMYLQHDRFEGRVSLQDNSHCPALASGDYQQNE